jgi:hypothetical protein
VVAIQDVEDVLRLGQDEVSQGHGSGTLGRMLAFRRFPAVSDASKIRYASVIAIRAIDALDWTSASTKSSSVIARRSRSSRGSVFLRLWAHSRSMPRPPAIPAGPLLNRHPGHPAFAGVLFSAVRTPAFAHSQDILGDGLAQLAELRQKRFDTRLFHPMNWTLVAKVHDTGGRSRNVLFEAFPAHVLINGVP